MDELLTLTDQFEAAGHWGDLQRCQCNHRALLNQEELTALKVTTFAKLLAAIEVAYDAHKYIGNDLTDQELFDIAVQGPAGCPRLGKMLFNWLIRVGSSANHPYHDRVMGLADNNETYVGQRCIIHYLRDHGDI
jgi:hypothetical protein